MLRPIRGFSASDWPNGAVVETTRGRHFQMDQWFPAIRRHGSYELSDLHHLDPTLLCGISGGEIPHTGARRWAFLDTETTGLAGGSGTCAFLIGLGSIEDEGFRAAPVFPCGISMKKPRLWKASATTWNTSTFWSLSTAGPTTIRCSKPATP